MRNYLAIGALALAVGTLAGCYSPPNLYKEIHQWRTQADGNVVVQPRLVNRQPKPAPRSVMVVETTVREQRMAPQAASSATTIESAIGPSPQMREGGIRYASAALDQGKFTDYYGRFADKYWKKVEAVINRYPGYEVSFTKAAQEHQVPLELLVAVSGVESELDPLKISTQGALGMTQMMPSMAATHNLKPLIGNAKSRGPDYAEMLERKLKGKTLESARKLDVRTDPVVAINMLATEMRNYHDAFGSWEAAVAAWNSGPNRDYATEQWVSGTPKETQRFIPQVFALQQHLIDAGLFDEKVSPPAVAHVPRPPAQPTVPPKPVPAVQESEPFTYLGIVHVADTNGSMVAMHRYAYPVQEGDTELTISQRFTAADVALDAQGRKWIPGSTITDHFITGEIAPGNVVEISVVLP